MKEKTLKITAVLGLVTVSILAVCWVQEVEKRVPSEPVDVAVSEMTELTQERLLDEMSGNKGYDSMTAEQKAAFNAEQIEILNRLSSGRTGGN